MQGALVRLVDCELAHHLELVGRGAGVYVLQVGYYCRCNPCRIEKIKINGGT